MAESTEAVEQAATEIITNEELEKVKEFLSGVAPTIANAGMQAHVFANDHTNPAPFAILDMIYQGVLSNTLGIMVGKHKDSGVEVPVLVGISGVNSEGATLYPVAVAINAEHASAFLAPDGEGGYVG